MIFLVRDPTAIIDHAQQKEGGGAFAGVEPGWGRELFEIRGADIKLPELITVLRLEPHRRGLPPDGPPVQAPGFQIRVDGGLLQEPFGGLHVPRGRVHAIVFQQTNGLTRGEMAAFAIGRADLEGRDEFEVALQLRFG